MVRDDEHSASLVKICDIAQGGMASVELVVHREGPLSRLYARKRLRAALLDDASARTMFLDEARIAALVRHPNVVSVHTIGQDKVGPYLLMDYVEGIPLSAIMSTERKAGRPIPIQVCVRIARQVASGLHAAHELTAHDGRSLGLVHRDLSPQNVLVGFDGLARVTDFGVAQASGRSTRTETGVLKGKLGYMSPEQLRFDKLDRRSDLFALGVILFEMIESRRLYVGDDTSTVARRIIDEPAPDLGATRADVPADLVALGFELLAKDPDLRPADARVVARRLSAIVRALEIDEGPLELDEYLRMRFDDAEVKKRRELAAQLRSGAVALDEAGPIASAPGESSQTTTDATTRPELRRRRRPRALIALALVATAAAGAWLLAELLPSRAPLVPAPVPDVAAPPTRASTPQAAGVPTQPLPLAPTSTSTQTQTQTPTQPHASRPSRRPAARRVRAPDRASGRADPNVPVWRWR